LGRTATRCDFAAMRKWMPGLPEPRADSQPTAHLGRNSWRSTLTQARIREAQESDMDAIRELVIAAFGPDEGPTITQLISDLLGDPSAVPSLSLVATIDRTVVGYVLFTHAEVRRPGRVVAATILAPLAVHPTVQSKGIGERLIMAGVESMTDRRAELVFVLGHPGYYPRYGFQPAGALGFEAPYPIPIEHANAWMVRALRPEIIGAISGVVRCAAALRDPQYWRE